MDMEKTIQLSQSLLTKIPNTVTDDIGLNILLAYNLNGYFGKTMKEFFDLCKLNSNIIKYCSLNNFYIYCIDDDTKSYFETVKSWGVNIVDICKGEKEFFDTIKNETEIPTGKYIKKGKKIIQQTRKEITVTYEIKDNYKEFFMPHFNRATINPPYDGNLHLKILNNTISLADEVVNISPDNHFYSMDKFNDWNENNVVIDTLSHLKNATFLSGKEFGDLFNCGWGVTTVHIGNYDSNKYDWTKHIKFDLKLLPIYTKIRNKANRNSFRSHFVSKNQITNGFLIRRMVNEYQIIKNDVEKSIIDNNSSKIREGLNFDTDVEKNIFLDSLHYWCYKLMNNVFNDLNPAHLPYLDYSKKLNNEELCRYFEIEGYVSDNEAIEGSEWETIINLIKE